MKLAMQEKFIEHQAQKIELSKITGEGEGFGELTQEQQAEYIRTNMGIRPDKVRRQSIAVKQLKIKKATREFQGKQMDRKSL